MKIKFEDLPKIRQRFQNERIVFKGGGFDLFHYDHLEGLRIAKEQGNILVIGISRDARLKQRKGPNRPIITQYKRLAIVDAIKYVDYAFLMPMPEPNAPSPTMRVLESLRPDIFAEHYSTEFRWSEADKRRLKNIGVKIFLDRRTRQTSTTSLIDHISKR